MGTSESGSEYRPSLGNARASGYAPRGAEAPGVDRSILGMPGTGKTHTLLNILEDELESGVPPERIGAVTFRRSMAEEFRDRSIVVLSDYDPDLLVDGELPGNHWMRTVHAACYRLLDLENENVVSDADKYEFCSEFRIPYSGPSRTDDEAPSWMSAGSNTGTKLGNQLFQLVSYCRNAFLDPRRDWRRVPCLLPETRQDIGTGAAALIGDFVRDYEAFKADRGLYDFDDMLIEVLEQELFPPVDVLIEDEFQDKTPLQVAVHEQWAEYADRVYVAGDPHQAIYDYQGTDPRFMRDAMSRAVEADVLDTCYRFGPELWEFATPILSDAGYDLPDIEPQGESGVSAISWDRYTDLVGSPEVRNSETLHLARANYKLSDVSSVLSDEGVIYSGGDGNRVSYGGNSWSEEMIQKFDALAALYSAIEQTASEFGQTDLSGISVTEAKTVLPMLRSGMFAGGKESTIREAETAKVSSDLDLEEWLDISELVALVENPTPFDALPPSSVSTSMKARQRMRTAWLERDGEPIGDASHRLATIHGAKGREADIVFLLDSTTRRITREADPKSEARTWFVGATRARDQLYIVRTGDHRTYSFPARSREVLRQGDQERNR